MIHIVMGSLFVSTSPDESFKSHVFFKSTTEKSALIPARRTKWKESRGLSV